MTAYRSSRSEVFLGKEGVVKTYRKSTGEHPCQSIFSIKLLCNFIEIALRHGFSPVNLLHIFRIPFLKNNSGGLLLGLHLCSKKGSATILQHFIKQLFSRAPMNTSFCIIRVCNANSFFAMPDSIYGVKYQT